MKEYTDIITERIKEANAKIVLELGVGEAYSTMAILRALQETDGHLYSCDIRPMLNGVQRVKDNGFDMTRWDFTNIDDLVFVETWDKMIDVLYIDTSHYLMQTFYELKAYAKFVKSDGFILMHDTLHNPTTNNEGWDIMPAVHKFMALYTEWCFEELLGNDIGKCGLGLLYHRKKL